MGTSYTDVNVQLPTTTVLSVIAGAISVFLFWEAYPVASLSSAMSASVPFPRTSSPQSPFLTCFRG
uniref:Uncharacterized protein n=1 Tax=Desertifilum tharense IPPAS B-1220 TaxID=1781255 RepID=A0ACD5GW54_9CYAN